MLFGELANDGHGGMTSGASVGNSKRSEADEAT